MVNQQNLENNYNNELKKLNHNHIHILYFSYKICCYNFIKHPLLIFTKLFSFLKSIIDNKRIDIDHVCHISRFIKDEETGDIIAKIFEANTERGMEENFLFDRVKNFKGKIFIEDVGEVQKQLAKQFEEKHLHIKYSKILAVLSALDGIFDKIKYKTNRMFCSYFVADFLKNQGFNLRKESKEYTPADIYNLHFGEKKLFIKND